MENKIQSMANYQQFNQGYSGLITESKQTDVLKLIEKQDSIISQRKRFNAPNNLTKLKSLNNQET